MSEDYCPYHFTSLDALRRKGVRQLRIWCVGRPKCTSYGYAQIDELIERHGPSMTLSGLARRMRCNICGGRGAHIEPADPRAEGMTPNGLMNEKADFRWP